MLRLSLKTLLNSTRSSSFHLGWRVKFRWRGVTPVAIANQINFRATVFVRVCQILSQNPKAKAKKGRNDVKVNKSDVHNGKEFISVESIGNQREICQAWIRSVKEKNLLKLKYIVKYFVKKRLKKSSSWCLESFKNHPKINKNTYN